MKSIPTIASLVLGDLSSIAGPPPRGRGLSLKNDPDSRSARSRNCVDQHFSLAPAGHAYLAEKGAFIATHANGHSDCGHAARPN